MNMDIDPDYATTFYQQNLHECLAMARHALSSGLAVSGQLLQTLYSIPADAPLPGQPGADTVVRQIGEIHAKLAQIIAPATPRTILILDSANSQNALLRFLGPVPLIRQMMIVAVVSLVVFIVLTLSPDVDGTVANSDILKSSGTKLFLNEMFLLSAAAVGASFYALFQANRYIQEGTFDPKYNVSYWIRFVLGLIAGFILATLIDIPALESGKEAADTIDTSSVFGRPLLAMIGGFSASLLYRILSRLTDTIESLFRGEVREQQNIQNEALRTKLQADAGQERTQLAYGLMDLQKLTSSGADPKLIQQSLDHILGELMGANAPNTNTAPVDTASDFKTAKSTNKPEKDNPSD